MAEIKQVEMFDGVSAKQLYNALMSSRQHTDFTGASANIENKVGGKFTAWDDYIEGENLELEPDMRIVQKWRASDWPNGEWSTATYSLNNTNEGCELTFTQTNVPDEMVKDVEQGWIEYYWQPLKKYFAK